MAIAGPSGGKILVRNCSLQFVGTHKLHHELRTFLLRYRIKLGRDRLHLLSKEHGMLVKA